MEKVKTLTKKQIKQATTEELDLKEPSIIVEQTTKTNNEPSKILFDQPVEQTKVYKPVIDNETDEEDYEYKYLNLLNMMLVIFIIILIIIITVAIYVGLQLLGVI